MFGLECRNGLCVCVYLDNMTFMINILLYAENSMEDVTRE
jgi:hypothetical protein